ncbi:MAG: Gfo/Idh/MocA family oxidoreductase [Phycisphaerales bacterium]
MTETDRRTFLKTTGQALAVMSMMPALAFAADVELKNELSVAIIGMGRQGRAIAGELQKIKGVKISAVCDVDPGRLRSGARRVAGAATFEDAGKLLAEAKDVKAVFIATPTHTHRAIVEASVAAGKHVYCEAPLASTVDDCRAIAAATRGASTVCVAGLLARSNPVYQLARTFFRSDSVRELVAMRAQSNEKTTWRSPAPDPAREKDLNWRLDPELSIGLAGELGTHQFDVFHYYRDVYPTSVVGRGSIQLHKDGRKVNDTIAAMLGFDDGTVLQYAATLGNSFEGTHEGSTAPTPRSNSRGRTAGCSRKQTPPHRAGKSTPIASGFHNEEGITLIADATQLASQGKLESGVGLPNPPLYYGLGDFLKSITEGAPVATTIEEGMRATIIGILTHQAVTTGETVKIDPALLAGG